MVRSAGIRAKGANSESKDRSVVGVTRRFTEAISLSSSFVIRKRMNSFVMSRFSQSLFTENSTEGLSIKYPPLSVSGIGEKLYAKGDLANASDWLSRFRVPDTVSP